MLINIKNSFANGEVKEFKEVKNLKESRQMLYGSVYSQKGCWQ
jgi:hypothetical protein